jgi:GT2 family glycosyltransferase
MTTITVVTPWHRAPELRQGYWAAIHASPPDEVIVVENGTSVATADDVDLTPFGGGFAQHFHYEPRNLGFAPACNIGLNAAVMDAVLFLNNDVRHTADGWLEPIRRALRPGVLVGANLRSLQHSAVDGRTIPYLDGWCVAGMRQDLLTLGGWDETYEEPSYYGDNDLSLRARAAGMKLIQVDVPLRHLGNYTSRQINRPADVAAVSARNYARYAAKARHHQAAA